MGGVRAGQAPVEARLLCVKDRAEPGTPPGFHVLRPEPREETLAGVAGAPPIVHRGAGRRAEIALSFDDGPSRWTAEIAAAFELHGCLATFSQLLR